MDEQIQQPQPKIRPCPHCGQPMPIKSPWKALFRKPTMNEWITLFIMIMMVVAAYAYKHDVGICQEYIKNFDYYCMQRGGGGYAHPPNNSMLNNFTLNLGGGVVIENETQLNQSNYTIPG